MYPRSERIRPERQLLERPLRMRGWSAAAGSAARPRPDWAPARPSDAELAACTCPTDCIRDHEND